MSGSISVQVGTADADIITANAGESLVAFGLAGDDTLTGAELADFLFGDTGDDTLAGNAGNDLSMAAKAPTTLILAPATT